MKLKDLAIVDPGGNVTAIVFDEVPASQRSNVNNAVLASIPLVEQVLFVERRNNKIHGQMAGGEFCGNAARSLGYAMATEATPQQTFTLSGLRSPLMVEAGTNTASLFAELSVRHEKRAYKKSSIPVVHFDGISHAVFFSSDPCYEGLLARTSRENEAIHFIFGELGLSNCAASGLLFVDESGDTLKLKPFVHVRAINTLYAETACASGSIAVTSILGKETSIVQPSGKTLHTIVRPKGDHLQAEVTGYAAILSRGTFYG